MSQVYTYDNKDNPDLGKIHIDVDLSAMTDKGIEYCRWDEDLDNGLLKVIFTNSLSTGDKIILDGIVDGV